MNIFVSIAAYRDAETKSTIANLLQQASGNHKIRICVAEQMFDTDPFSVAGVDGVSLRIKIPGDKVFGVGFTRWELAQQFSNEHYFLQIDAHTQFDKDWDQTLIQQLELTMDPKAVLSGYPKMYNLSDRGEVQLVSTDATSGIVATGFSADGQLSLGHDVFTGPTRRGAFIAGGFIFARADFIADVPFDRNILFIGEEVIQSAQAFTRGYNVYYPSVMPVYHHYTRPTSPHIWSDQPEAWATQATANTQYCLSIMDGKVSNYFGTVRTLQEFMDYCGVDFPNRKVTTVADTTTTTTVAP